VGNFSPFTVRENFRADCILRRRRQCHKDMKESRSET
jgi:hypothetical protein